MICIEANQSYLKKSQRLPKKLLEKVAVQVSNALRIKSTRLISVAFVSEKEMKKLNKQYRGNNWVTDVLSFNLKGLESYGEIILNYTQAKRQAQIIKHTVNDELIFLLVHGLLHLFGYDHEKKPDAKRMFSVQEKITKGLNTKNI